MVSMQQRPLEGVTIIDLSEVWAGPMGLSFLGDLGARVIKIESYPRWPHTRIKGRATTRGYVDSDPNAPKYWDRAAGHNMANRNKFGVTLNLGDPRGVDLFKKLVSISDVVAEAYSAGTMERLGIHYESVKQVKSDIIMVSMPGFGFEGPYKGYVSLGTVIDGFTGYHLLRGYPGTDPTVTPVVNHGDAIGSTTLAFAILVALYHRRKTGQGQFVDISQVECMIPHLGRPLMDSFMNGRELSPLGNKDYYRAPYGCYRCLGDDNWVVITVSTEEEWKSMCEAMGRGEWVNDRRFDNMSNRYCNQADLDKLIEEWTSCREKHEVMGLLQTYGVAASAVLRFGDLYSDSHLLSRGFFETLSHPNIGTHRYPRQPWKLSKTCNSDTIPPNGLGEHNDYVYGTLLGLDQAEIQDLRSKSVIGDP